MNKYEMDVDPADVSTNALPSTAPVPRKKVVTDADLRHRFLTFSEQLKAIDVKVSHRSDRYQDEDKEDLCFFAEGLERWRDTNRSQDFCDYRIAVRNLSGNLSLLVLHQSEIVDLTVQYLSKPKSLAAEPLLELIVHLARDLGGDFYHHFYRVFDCLVLVVSPPDKEPVAADIIGATFRTLAYCFKFLRQNLLGDIEKFFERFRAVLDRGHPTHVRKFAAESYGYLLRKLPDDKLGGHLRTIFETVVCGGAHEEYIESVSALLAESVKNLARQFVHRRTSRLIEICLGLVEERESVDAWTNVLKRCYCKLIEHTQQKYADSLWGCTINQLVRMISSDPNNKKPIAIGHTFDIVATAAHHWDGSRITERMGRSSVDAILSFLGYVTPYHDESPCTAALSLAEAILIYKPNYVDGKKLMKGILSTDEHLHTKLAFGFRLINAIGSQDGHAFHLIRFVTQILNSRLSGISTKGKTSLNTVTSTVTDDRTTAAMTFLVQVTRNSDVANNLPQENRSDLQNTLISLLQVANSLDQIPVSFIWSVCAVIKEVGTQNEQASATLSVVLQRMLDAVSSKHNSTSNDPGIVHTISYCLDSLIGCTAPKKLCEVWELALGLLKIYPKCLQLLRACGNVLETLKLSGKNEESIFRVENQRMMLALIGDNLSALEEEKRLSTLRILVVFDQLPYSRELVDSDSSIDMDDIEVPKGKCDIFRRCLAVEQLPVDLDGWRERKIAIDILAKLRYNQMLPKEYRAPVIKYLTGSLGVNFTPLITAASEILVGMLDNYHAEGWPVIRDSFGRISTSVLSDILNQSSDSAKLPEASENASDASVGDSLALNSVMAQDMKEASPGHHVDTLRLHGTLADVLKAKIHLTERHNREIVPLFLQFMTSGYDVCFQGSARRQDLRINSIGESRTTGIESISSEKEKESSEPEPIISKKRITGMLCHFLNIFSAFSNPSQVHRGEDLERIFRELLLRSDQRATAQKLALACLRQYKFPYMKPYYEHLEALVEDGVALRDSLLKFSLNNEEQIIKPEHRPELLKIVHRILLAKMMYRKTKGKGARDPKTRRRQILRYFDTCSPEEMESFVDLLFEPYSDSVDLDDLPKPSSVVPLQKQLGYLNNLPDLITILGSTIERAIERVVSIILRIVYDADCILNQRNEIASGHVAVLKSIRISGTRRLGDVLLAYPGKFPQHLSKSIDDMIVKRPLTNLHSESYQHPSAVLEFFLKCSSDRKLHRILTGLNDSILPRIIELLSVVDVNDSVVEVVLTIADNLMAPDKDSEAGDKIVEAKDAVNADDLSKSGSVLVPHIPLLLQHLPSALLMKLNEDKSSSKSLFMQGGPTPAVRAGVSIAHGNGSKRGVSSTQQTFTTLQLSILSRITPYATDASTSTSVVSLLLPFLSGRPPAVLERHKVLILRTAIDTARLFGLPSVHYCYLSSLFDKLWSPLSRSLLSKLFVELGSRDTESSNIGNLLERFNAMDTSSVDNEPDYSTRVAAYREFNENVGCYNVEQLLPLAHTIVHDCAGEDVALRNNAMHSISLLIENLASRATLDDVNERGWASEKQYGLRQTSEFAVTINESTLVLGVIYASVQAAMRSHTSATREVFVAVLENLVTAFPKCPAFHGFSSLQCATNEEQDFFKNIRHIQIHRRIRAIRLVQSMVDQQEINEEQLLTVFHPLIGHFLFESSQTNEHNLINASVDFIGAICCHVSWPVYNRRILGKYIGLLKKRPRDEKVLIRTIVSILNNFQFSVDENDPEVKTEMQRITDPSDTGHDAVNNNADDDESVTKGNESNTSGAEILKTVTKVILPKMNKLLILRNKEENTVSLRSTVAVAIVQLLAKLPSIILDAKLPPLLVKVTGVLRDRMESTRDGARVTLGEIAQVVGAQKVPAMVREMRHGLTRGYQLHVLGYTVHHVLDVIIPQCPIGALDEGIEDFVPIFIDDIFGGVGEEKEVEGIARKLKEAKRISSFDSFAKVAKVLSPSKLNDLFDPLKDAMAANDDARTAQKLDEIFRNITLGLKSNQSFAASDTTKIATDLIKENLALSERGSTSSKSRQKMSSIFILPPEVLNKKTSETCYNTNAHLLVVMGLNLLSTQLKRSTLSENDSETVQALREFVPVLVSCLNSKFNKVIKLGLRVAASLLPIADIVTTIKSRAGDIAKRVFKLMRGSGSSASAVELTQTCFRVATILVRDCEWYDLTEWQTKVIISFVEQDLEATEKQQNAFAVLLAVMGRRIVVAELYSVMDKVAKLMVRSPSEAARKLCRHAMLRFLLDYPLGPKRLEQTILFIVSNLDFELVTGCESAMLLLESTIVKFPDTVINEYAELFFVSVAKQQISDTSSTVRQLAAQSLRALLLRVPPSVQDTLFKMTVAWIRSATPDICRTGILAISVFVDALGKKFSRHAAQAFELVSAVLVSVSAAVEEDEQNSPDDAPQMDSWELLYSASICLEKIFKGFPDILATSTGNNKESAKPKKKRKKQSSDAELENESSAQELTLWNAVLQNLLHGHSWVRLASSRLFGLYFSQFEATASLTGYLAQDSATYKLGKTFCSQLDCTNMAQPLADQLVKNLFFVGRHLYSIFATLPESQFGDKQQPDESSDKRTSGLVYITKQLCYLARTECTKSPELTFKRECVFKWFAAMANSCLNPPFASRFLPTIAESLFRTDESDKSSDSIRDLASQVQDVLKKSVGAAAYFAIFEDVRSKLANARLVRKRDRKTETVKNPIKAAERKLKKNANKRLSRKRKIDNLREAAGRPVKKR